MLGLIVKIFNKTAFRYCVTRRFNSTTSIKSYDVAIVGGGMVGFSMAAALSRNPVTRNLRILLLESSKKSQVVRQSPLPEGAPYKNRVVALSPATKRFLDSIGVWPLIERERLQAVKQMYVWETHSDAFLSLDKDNFSDDLAYIVENEVVLNALGSVALQNLNEHSEVRFETQVSGATIPSITAFANPATVTFKDGSQVNASLVVAADGYNSLVRKSSAVIGEITWPHDKAAVVATLCVDQGTDPTVAWQRFHPNGPIAYLPLSGFHISLVWSSTKSEAKRLMSLGDTEFVHELNEAMWRPSQISPMVRSASGMLDRTFDFLLQTRGGAPKPSRIPPTISSVVPSSRATFPLGFMLAKDFIAPRMALVGDAAHRILPLAGQGVNLGFGDVDSLTRIIADAVAQGADIGSINYLRHYETERQRFILPVAGTIEGLQALYSFTASPVVLARSLGLKVCNAVPFVKNAIVSSATQGALRVFN